MKLIIDRSKWLRGEGDEVSRLLRPSDGKMCCLGFFSLACGASRESIHDKQTPGEAKRVGRATGIPDWATWSVKDGKDSALGLMVINDDVSLSGREREEKIAALFADRGVEVEFIDGEQP